MSACEKIKNNINPVHFQLKSTGEFCANDRMKKKNEQIPIIAKANVPHNFTAEATAIKLRCNFSTK